MKPWSIISVLAVVLVGCVGAGEAPVAAIPLPPDTVSVSPDTVSAPEPSVRPARRPPAKKPCCRVCRTGKACGNGCIARNRTCRQPPGCACNG